MAAFGFPGTNGFFSKLLVLLGVFQTNTWLGVLFVVGLLLGLAYLLRLLLNVGWGAPSTALGWRDMNFREWVYLLPLGLLVIYLGVAPGRALSFLGPSIDNLLLNFEAKKEIRIDTASGPGFIPETEITTTNELLAKLVPDHHSVFGTDRVAWYEKGDHTTAIPASISPAGE
jgi:formate hydrogenlyase subunit 3/multisubunit Na+/H+ antiporter MnhD subunit